MLKDPFGRKIDYVRWSVTDRCNLRCTYCMPEEKMQFVDRKDLLSFEEMEQMLRVFEHVGIRKIRFTGGEPFMRKDIMRFFERVAASKTIQEWHITSNGTLLRPHLKNLKKLGVSGINISLDTLSADRFEKMTKRNQFEEVQSCIQDILDLYIPLKINTVVQAKANFDELKALALLSKTQPIDLRFIEYMPFNGSDEEQRDFVSAQDILNELEKHFTLSPIQQKHGATSQDYSVEGFMGKIGVIAAHTRSFCGACNRLRISAKGNTQVCLYGVENQSLGRLIKTNTTDQELIELIHQLIAKKPKNGFDAEAEMLRQTGTHKSMSAIGG